MNGNVPKLSPFTVGLTVGVTVGVWENDSPRTSVGGGGGGEFGGGGGEFGGGGGEFGGGGGEFGGGGGEFGGGGGEFGGGGGEFGGGGGEFGGGGGEPPLAVAAWADVSPRPVTTGATQTKPAPTAAPARKTWRRLGARAAPAPPTSCSIGPPLVWPHPCDRRAIVAERSPSEAVTSPRLNTLNGGC